MHTIVFPVFILGPMLWMALGYWRARKAQDMGIVDLLWASGIGVFVAVAYFLVGQHNLRQILALSVALLWSIRLASFLKKNRVNQHTEEDPRYQVLRKKWGENANRNFFFFFQFQALLIAFFALPFLVVMSQGGPLTLFDYVALAWALLCVLGEALADAQLKAFKARPNSKGKTCQEGLWRYSRHPNYFFEWLYWFTPVWMGITAPYGWVTLMAPTAMLFFLFKVTGIPYTEAQSLKSRPESYRRYQETTSVFIPWFPKAD